MSYILRLPAWISMKFSSIDHHKWHKTSFRILNHTEETDFARIALHRKFISQPHTIQVYNSPSQFSSRPQSLSMNHVKWFHLVLFYDVSMGFHGYIIPLLSSLSPSFFFSLCRSRAAPIEAWSWVMCNGVDTLDWYSGLTRHSVRQFDCIIAWSCTWSCRTAFLSCLRSREFRFYFRRTTFLFGRRLQLKGSINQLYQPVIRTESFLLVIRLITPSNHISEIVHPQYCFRALQTSLNVMIYVH